MGLDLPLALILVMLTEGAEAYWATDYTDFTDRILIYRSGRSPTEPAGRSVTLLGPVSDRACYAYHRRSSSGK